MKPGLNRKHPPCWLFYSAGRGHLAADGELLATFLCALMLTSKAGYACLPTGDKTNSFLTDVQPAPQVGVGTVNQDKKPVAGKVIGPNGEATFIVLLHGCDESVKLPSKYMCSSPEITTVVSINLRITRDAVENTCLKKLGHSEAKEAKPNSSSQVNSYSYPRFSNHCGRGVKRREEQEGGVECCVTFSSKAEMFHPGGMTSKQEGK